MIWYPCEDEISSPYDMISLWGRNFLTIWYDILVRMLYPHHMIRYPWYYVMSLRIFPDIWCNISAIMLYPHIDLISLTYDILSPHWYDIPHMVWYPRNDVTYQPYHVISCNNMIILSYDVISTQWFDITAIMWIPAILCDILTIIWC